MLLSILSIVFVITLATLVIVVFTYRVSDRSSSLLQDQVPKIIEYMEIEEIITEEIDAVSLFIETGGSPEYLQKFRDLSEQTRLASTKLLKQASPQDKISIQNYFYTEEDWQLQINNKVIPFYESGQINTGRLQWEKSKEMGNLLKQQIITFFTQKQTDMKNASLETTRYIQQTIRICLALIFSTVLGAILLTFWFSRSFLQPIVDLSQKVHELAAGQMDIRAEVGTKDEIGQLGSNFNKLAISLSQMFKQFENTNTILAIETEQSREQTRLKSEFLAMVSHELRTPLHAIMGFSEVLEEEYAGPLTSKQQLYVSHIRKSGAHLLSLINDLLDLSKIEAGKMELDYTEELAPHFLQDTLVLVQEQASKKDLHVTFTAEGEGHVILDVRKVKQILLNLLSNAVKYTETGGQIGLDVWVGTGILKFSVSDTGRGIPQRHLEDIFSEFFQTKDPGPEHIEGTGLGLALTKRLVVLHGGSIEVKSQEGIGSLFTVILPVKTKTNFIPLSQRSV